MDGEQTLNHGNTHVFAPIANKLFERASQLVYVKVRGSVSSLSLSQLFPRIRCFRIMGVIVRVSMQARIVFT